MYKLSFHYIQINEYSSSFPITKEEKMCTCDFREEGQKKKKTKNNLTNHCCSRFIKKKICTQPPFKIFDNVIAAMHNYEDIVK